MMTAAFVSCFFLGLGIICGVFLLFPSFLPSLFALTEENGVIESATFALYLVSALYAGYAAFISRKKLFPLLFTAAGLIFFLDEVSWGKSILEYRPRVALGVEIDAAHDFIDIGLHFLGVYGSTAWFVTMVLGGAILSILAVAHWWKQCVRAFARLAARLRTYPHVRFLGMVAVLFFLSTVLDTEQMSFPALEYAHFQILEEYFELSAGLAFLLFCIDVLIQSFQEMEQRRASCTRSATRISSDSKDNRFK